MSKTKEYLENLSYELGFDGEITDEVLREAELRQASWHPDKPPLGLIQQNTELDKRFINRIINISDAYFDEENDDADAEVGMRWIDEAITEYYEAKQRLDRLVPDIRRKPWLTTEADKIQPWRKK